MPQPKQNTEAEIDAFVDACNQLSGFDDRVSADWVDGYMTALLAGPRAVSPDEWVSTMCGDVFQRAFADPQAVEQAMQALTMRWNAVAGQLDPEQLLDDENTLRLNPLISEWTEEDKQRLIEEGHLTAEEAQEWPMVGEVWALGFLDAIEDFTDDWPEPDVEAEDGRYFDSCLRQIAALTLEEGGDDLAEHMEEFYPGKTMSRDTLIDEACFAVQDLRVFWVDHAPKPETRRVEKTPGRNDPCPCGSGKKYKKCHGAA